MKNRSWKFLRLFVGSLAILGFTNACATSPKSPKPIPYNINPFKTDYFDKTKPGNPKHLAVFFKVTGNGRLKLRKLKKAEVRPGPFPYNSRRGGGDTKIVYLNSANEEIGHYYIENPTTKREERFGHPGSGKPEPLPGVKETELLIPDNDNIAFIDIIYPERFKMKGIKTINHVPVLDPIANITVNEGETVTFSPTATDQDGDALTYSYSGWMCSASYTTDNNDAGTHTVTVTVSDVLSTALQDVTVTVNDVR